jgi:Ser/Thr protein kinase RdoA (MazF antagonist)
MNSPHRVHGMGLDPVDPDWPPLTEAEIQSLIQRYPMIGRVEGIAWHSPRPFSAAARVETDHGDIIVKRHHRHIRDVAGLSEEHRFIDHLQRHSLPVAEIIPSVDGVTAITDGDWTYEIHRKAAGLDLYRDALSWSPFQSVAHATAAGRMLAQLHRAAADYVAPARQARTLVTSFTILADRDPIEATERYLGSHPDAQRFMAGRRWQSDFRGLVLPFHTRLFPYLPVFQPLWTHNDWHASNLLWTENDVAAVLDFGLADRTCAIHDLATAIERNTIEWLRISEGTSEIVHWDQVQALIDGYESITKLSSTESAALIALLPIVHVEFALSEVGYFDSVLNASSEAALAYDTYLLGHADWFNTPPGRGLLDYLEAHRTCDDRTRGFRFAEDAPC